MKKVIKTNTKEILYFIGYFLMGLSSVVIGNSYLFGAKRFTICEVVQYISAAFFLLSFMRDKYKITNLINVILIGVVVSLSTIFMHNIALGLYGLSVIVATHIDIRKIVKYSVINNIIFLIIVIVPALLGLIPDDIYRHGNMIAHGLGFAYYSNMSYIVFMCTIAIYWLIKSKKVEKIFLILSVPVHILVYKISTVRLVFYLYIVFLVIAFAVDKINKRKQHKLLLWVATVMYPLMATFIIVASFMYEKSKVLSAFNVAINYRLNFNLQGFQKYGVKLFGQKIVEVAEYIDDNFINHYFYIDCGYVYMLIGYGAILFVIIMMIYIMISRDAVKKNDMKLFCWCVVVCLFSIINNIMFITALNPLPIIGLNLIINDRATLRTKNKKCAVLPYKNVQ